MTSRRLLWPNIEHDQPCNFRVRVRVRTIFERRSGDRTRVDGVCDIEKVRVRVGVRTIF